MPKGVGIAMGRWHWHGALPLAWGVGISLAWSVGFSKGRWHWHGALAWSVVIGIGHGIGMGLCHWLGDLAFLIPYDL